MAVELMVGGIDYEEKRKEKGRALRDVLRQVDQSRYGVLVSR